MLSSALSLIRFTASNPTEVMASVRGFLTFRKLRINSPLNTVRGFFFLCIDQITFNGWATVLTYSKPHDSAAFYDGVPHRGFSVSKHKAQPMVIFENLEHFTIPSVNFDLKWSALCRESP